jgi:hypothetical protein
VGVAAEGGTSLFVILAVDMCTSVISGTLVLWALKDLVNLKGFFMPTPPAVDPVSAKRRARSRKSQRGIQRKTAATRVTGTSKSLGGPVVASAAAPLFVGPPPAVPPEYKTELEGKVEEYTAMLKINPTDSSAGVFLFRISSLGGRAV